MWSASTMKKCALSDRHFVHFRRADSEYYSEIICCCVEMPYSLERRAFLALKFHRLDHSIFFLTTRFQRTFTIKKSNANGHNRVYNRKLLNEWEFKQWPGAPACGSYKYKRYRRSASDPTAVLVSLRRIVTPVYNTCPT